MPNVVANRLSSQFNFTGQGFTISSEELSGVRALEVAMRALQTGELETALVGAVDMSAETVHQEALVQLGLPARVWRLSRWSLSASKTPRPRAEPSTLSSMRTRSTTLARW